MAKTLKQLAQEAGVSIATVSKVVTEEMNISAKRQENESGN